jgi:leader peptidase (prepilin peptidase) / N-methyltransferase
MTSVVGVRPPPSERLVSVPAAFLVAVSLAAWAFSGRAVAVPLTAVGAISVLAGVIDARTSRIPNRVVLAGLVAFLAGAVITMIGDHRSPSGVTGAALVGVIASGAPLLALVWLVRPASVGAGDVKLLTVQGATMGLLAPLAAPIVLLGGALGGLVFTVVLRRCRTVPLGPGLAMGFIAAVVSGTTANVLFGGIYA